MIYKMSRSILDHIRFDLNAIVRNPD